MIQTKEQIKLDDLLALTFEIDQETWLGSENERKEILEKLLHYAQTRGFPFGPDDPEFLPKLRLKILEEYQKAPKLPPGNMPPPELNEAFKKAQQRKEVELQKKIASQKTYQDYQNYVDFWRKKLLKNQPGLPPKLSEAIAEKVANKTIVHLPAVAQTDFLTEDDLQQIQKEESQNLENELKNLKIESKPQILQEAEEIVAAEAQKVEKEKKEVVSQAEKIVEGEWQKLIKKIATEPQIMEAVKEKSPIKNVPIDLKKLSLPSEIVKQIEAQIIKGTYSPLRTILDPQESLVLAKRTFYTLQAKAIQMKVAEMQVPTDQKEAFERFKKMVYQGLFKEDLQATSEFLKKLGLPENHPAFNYLNSEIGAFDEIQKVDIKNWLGKIVGRGDHPYVKILKKYYDYVKKTGKWQVFDKNLNAFLKLSPDVLWANKKGYSFLVKRLVDKFQFLPNLYQKTFRLITRGNYNSLGGWTQKFVYGKVLKPFFAKIGQTVAGQAVKAGFKKAAGWLAAKVGLKIGIWAAGAASGPPGWIATAATIALDILKTLGRKIFGFVRRIFQEPDKALGSVGVGVLLLVFIPMPLALIGIIPLLLGGASLISFALAPATLGAIGGGIGAFFTAISTLPFIFPVVLFVVTLLSVLAGLTLFIVIVVSGAFVLPQKVPETTPTTISPYESEYFVLTKTANHSTLDNSDLDKTEIEYTVKIEAKKENKLTISDITETISVQTAENKVLNVAPHDFTKDLAENNEVTLDKPLVIKYTIKPPAFFADSAIINTVNVNLAVGGNVPGTFPGTASAIVVIGNPPINCPSGWPIIPSEAIAVAENLGVKGWKPYITQGPGAGSSHQGDEAIDISVFTGTPVHATHQGTVIATGYNSGEGNYVHIQGTCNGQIFESRYAHLRAFFVRVGEPVVLGSKIADSNDTGNSTNPHLDYRFMNLKMEPPFIPRDVRGCSDFCGNL